MKHLAAYLLLRLGGNSDPCVEDICGVLASVGIECDNDRAEALVKELCGKEIDQVYLIGIAKLL